MALKNLCKSLSVELIIGTILHLTLTPLGFPVWAIFLIELYCTVLAHTVPTHPHKKIK
jgi:hypothetical protein